MADYREMYETMFNRITDIIEELKELQQEMEEMYIRSEDAPLRVLGRNHQEEE